ncbi:MAG: hypothetical protein HS128_12480 [Ideonella sp.]|nr:hypothetical protein [Ideonella sp.]MCC7459595.1 hypothetical protein [Nitrospira sp.]
MLTGTPLDLTPLGSLLTAAGRLYWLLAAAALWWALRGQGCPGKALRIVPAKVFICGSLLLALLGGLHITAQAEPYVPAVWTRFVKVDGQPEPIPEQWLDGDEARIAHNLKLPGGVPEPVPFDFDRAWWRGWLPGTPRVAVQYFNHLCSTEAGEWIFKKVDNVEGLYFARPQGPPSSDMLSDPYALEMPWIQRVFLLTGDSLKWQGTWFIQPPLYNYRFVEQPRRNTKWQKGIREPYVRLFGYTREQARGPTGNLTDHWKDKDPMQVLGIAAPTARFGYTWRGLKRPRDREHGISGGELLIYDLQSHEVLAVRRQFLIASRNPRGPGKAMWEVAARCAELPRNGVGAEFTQFAFDVLQTIEPSKTGE